MAWNVATDGALNPVKLVQMGQKFERFQRRHGKLSALARENYTKMMGLKEVSAIGDVDNPQPSGAIIETWQDASGAPGGDHYRIPVIGKLRTAPLSDTEAIGLGETIPITFRNLYLQIFRKPIKQVTKMQAQRTPLAILNAVNNSQSWLYDYWAEYQQGNLYHSLLTGYDVLLSDIRGIVGAATGVVPFSHPNMVVAGSGAVTYGGGRPGTAGFETSVQNACNAIIGNTAMGMTLDRMRWCQQHANELGIPQVQTPEGPRTVWLMDSRQYMQLKKDKDWHDTWLLSGPRDKTNTLFSNALAEIEGNVIFVEDAAFGIQHSGQAVTTVTPTGGNAMPAYGPTNFWIAENESITGLDNNSLKVAFILGEHALDKLYGRERFLFSEETGDFGRRKEVLLEAYQNMVRNDRFDTNNEYGNGAAAFYNNTSSLALVTWSPKAAMI